MHFTVENRDNIVIFTLNNQNVDSDVSAKFKAKLLILAQPDLDAMIIDLTSVESIDSSGLGALLLAHRQLKENAIPVILTGVQDFVMSLMRMTHLDDLFEFYEKELGLNFHLIKYENVIANFSKEITALLNYLDLKYEKNLEKFYITAKKRDKIFTPSYSQVINPLYSSSIGRWKKYSKIKNSKVKLQKWITKFGY